MEEIKYKEGLGRRLKELRKELSISQGLFAERIGLKQGTYSDIENENEILITRNMKIICHEFNVSESWLRKGEGDMFAPKPPFPTITGADGRPLEPEEQELLEIYDKLIPEIREDVRDYASEKLELQELRKQMGC